MVHLDTGDIFEADVEAIVNAVNCVGVMGKGLALAMKKRYPAVFEDYQRACAAGEVVPGRMHVVKTSETKGPRFVVNFPTKRHWRDKSRIDDIEAGLVDLVAQVKKRRIRSIAVPALGCGLGGLDWADVKPLIEEKLGQLEGVRVMVFEPK